ncbi:exosome complex exonuclease RRP6-like isoform X2 [Tribolium madens]|uniref:exosome complex exonuclease RRP6-like isoform X2 n=1 Tax=Tribolium madens TaxID=41895 RepID=UPI001CF74099|nr:exosome complex exonuclease RRP6-like isoform X2 [Tribolium madens]
MTTFQNKVKEEGIGDSFTVIDQTGQVSELNLNEGHNISDLNLETIDSLSNHTEESEFKTEPNNYQNTSLFTSDEIFEIEDDDEPPNETVIEKNNSEAEKHNETSTDTKTEDLTQDQEDEDETGSHPYICLIETFETPKELLKFTEIGATKPLENTKFVMVVTQNQILDMLQEVRNVKEVSLEPYCTQREFKRDITLLAISTRNTDYLLDVLKLKSQLLLLTEMFLNPKIVKIVFGASSVLATLQTLLHVYLVNIFDVEQARKILLEPPKNNYQLHQLIAHDYGVREKLTKASLNYYQSRPLSDRHIKFCRKNAHYLIYMYHDYKNKFILKDFEEYKIFLDYCREACKVVHKTEQLGKLQQLENELKVVHDCQKEVLKKLYDWNVKTAQMHNISVERVIPKDI